MRPKARVESHDETVTSERIIAVGDLYYIYQHEPIGVFPVVQKRQELLGVPVVLTGFALPGDAPRASNERPHPPAFHGSIETCAWFYAALGRVRFGSVDGPEPRSKHAGVE